MKKIITFVLVALVISACSTTYEPPVFLSIDKLQLAKIEGSIIKINTMARFKNPNDVGMKLREVDILVTLQGKNVGRVRELQKIKIKPSSEFTVPLTVSINLKDSGVLTGLFGMLAGKKMNIEFTGHIKISKGGFIVKVPIKHTDQIKLTF